MNQSYAIILTGLIMFNNLENAPVDNVLNLKQMDTQSLFDYPEKEDLYWQALVHIANNNKELALHLAASIKNETAIPGHHPWKESQPENINDFFDKLFIDSIHHDPQQLSQLNLFESLGIKDHNAYLTDISPQALMRGLEETKTNLLCLNNYSFDTLSQSQKTSYKIFAWLLNHSVDGQKFLFHSYPISQLEGVLINLSISLTQFHTLKTQEDVKNYISRLSKIPEQCQQAIELMQLQKEKGILPPRFAVEKVITMIQKSIPANIHKNIFYTNLEQHLGNMHVDDHDALLKQAYTVLTDTVYPAYLNLQNYFTQLLVDAQDNNGVWALPDGDAYYAHMLQHHTTTDLTADEIYQLGLQEVESIHAQMRALLATENIIDPTKNVGTLVQELAKDPQFYYPNTQDGRTQCLAEYQRILDRSRKELAHLFQLQPKTGVTIQRVAQHEEESAPGAYYYEPSADGSRAGAFFANLRNMNEIPKYSMETLTIHEAEPGHHFQIALQYEMNIPMWRKLYNYNAYCEGWALYTEKLAYEHNFYTSTFSKLGHLQDELLRAARLVIDTGIHHKRWSREQAIAYMQDVTGYHYDTVVSEVERYFVLPGQACSYKIGQLKILELRQKAKDILGEKFNICQFHNEILQLGSAPLLILQEVIDDYIKHKLAA